MKKAIPVIIFILIASFSFAQSNGNVRPTFVCDSLFLKDSTTLHWETSRESGALPFVIQQYLWGTWTKVGEVMGVGTEGSNQYSFGVFLNSGENNFRVVQFDSEGHFRVSQRLVFINTISPVTYVLTTKSVTFNRKTRFELWQDEKLITSGQGTEIEISNLSKGKYTLKYDNQIIVVLLK